MINFTVGPVQSEEYICEIGAEQVPYFRTGEFSDIMFENERLMKKFVNAPEGAKAVFITGSGTASMEASVMNTLSGDDKALVVNGGSFGQRFVDLLRLHEIPFDEIKLDYGKGLTKDILAKYDNKGYTAFLVNIHETSTGVHYNPKLIGEFCKKNNLFLIVDAISSFLADEFDMSETGTDIVITGSQKALACPPGVSIIVLSEKAIERVANSRTKCMYLDLKDALKNAERGQTPFTPAVGILRQINARLKSIDDNGGAANEIRKTAERAAYFRNRLKDYPVEVLPTEMSNAVTAVRTKTASAYDIFLTLKDEYGIWICPNGGELKDKVFRVGHIGFLTKEDYDKLFAALDDMKGRDLI